MAEIQAGRRTWVPPGGVLGELVAAANRRAAAIVRTASGDVPSRPASARGRFAGALRTDNVAIIAEIKRRSPSKGSLNESLEAGARAASYEAGGASALSVLTEPDRFGGSLADLREVRAAARIPLLRKDFIVHGAQLGEAVSAGADAVLLIARALDPTHADDLAREAAARGLGVLFEVRDETELARAVAVPGCVIGVNTRNLETLEVDPAVGAQLLPLVPRDRVAVYESGVATRADVERAAGFGADAVLVGSALSRVADGSAAVAALAGVPRAGRGARVARG